MEQKEKFKNLEIGFTEKKIHTNKENFIYIKQSVKEKNGNITITAEEAEWVSKKLTEYAKN